MTHIIDQLYRDMYSSAISVDRVLDAQRILAAASKKMGGFPFYNIKKTGDNKYAIEMALSGYSLADIEITLEKNKLTISSDGHQEDSSYIYKGFAFRKFSKSFTLMENIQVDGAELVNGVLSIWLSEFVKEEDKPKKINIQSPSAKSHPQLLNEDSVM